jgi:putative restriction endonuclease
MDRQGLIDQFSGLTIWKAGGERAPHKPLLVLLALARLQQEDRRLLPFTEIEPELKKLLEDFGPARKGHIAIES